MTLDSQVCNLELAKKLKELGVKQESYFHWRLPNTSRRADNAGAYLARYGENLSEKWFYYYSAFTVAELGEMLPEEVSTGKFLAGNYLCEYRPPRKKRVSLYEPTEADARAKMLIYLLEHKLITLQ